MQKQIAGLTLCIMVAGCSGALDGKKEAFKTSATPIAQFVATAPFCRFIGYQVDLNGGSAFLEATAKTGVQSGVTEEDVRDIIHAALDERKKTLRAEAHAAGAKLALADKAGDAQRDATLREFYRQQDARCAEFTTNNVLTPYISMPSPAEREAGYSRMATAIWRVIDNT